MIQLSPYLGNIKLSWNIAQQLEIKLGVEAL